MILILHILVALSSLAFATYLLFAPSTAGFRVNYALIGTTLASGTYLTITTKSHLLQTCLTGLLYLGAVATLTVAAKIRFAYAKNK